MDRSSSSPRRRRVRTAATGSGRGSGAPRPALAALFVASLTAVAGVPSTAQTQGGELPDALIPDGNWWTLDVRQAPLDPQSAQIIAWIGGDSLHPDFGGDADVEPEIYGMPYITVPPGQPLVPVTFVLYGDESDDGAPAHPPGYPVPPQAKTQPKWIEGGYPGNSSTGGDRHMLIVDSSRRMLYELYNAHWNSSLNRWEAGSGAVWPLDYSRRRPWGWTSADAAGLAILPGLVRYDEVYESTEPIRHAFRFTLQATNGHVFPASHTAGSTSGAPPLGLRLRLKANVDISGFSPPLRRIFQAMKTYGLILADNGSDMFIQGTYDPLWDNGVLNPAFGSFDANDFEVVQRGWRPALFTDVAAGHWARTHVEASAFAGVMGSCASTPRRFCPQQPVQRRDIGRFLLRSADSGSYQPPPCTSPPFADVPVSDPQCRWIRELAVRQIVGGCGGGNYCPLGLVNRAQLAPLLLRTLEGTGYLPPACTGAPFDDVPADHTFCRWIRELTQRGITGGCGNGNYCPGAPVLRSQIAVFLVEAFGLETR